jgi:hypothetical protein
MAHYAFLDADNNVIKVITGRNETDTQDLPEGYADWESYYLTNSPYSYADKCLRTSYNTINNEHILGGTAFRGNFANVGGTYDVTNDVFIPPKSYDSWVIDETTWTWKAPVDEPDLTDDEIAAGSYYQWNEDTTSWDLITP